jgi:hypothetical protein
MASEALKKTVVNARRERCIMKPLDIESKGRKYSNNLTQTPKDKMVNGTIASTQHIVAITLCLDLSGVNHVRLPQKT